jgi:hypothetical protein
VSATLFRGKFLAGLVKLHRTGRLVFQGSLARLADRHAFASLLERARRKEWVVYAKPPFGGPELVLRYLARYTHRVAISNSRLLSVEDGHVTFAYRDRADGDQRRTIRLPATEFLRRFLLHVLPKGFAKVRHYGLLSNRSEKLERCRQLLATPRQETAPAPDAASPSPDSVSRCPHCGSTALVRREITAQPKHVSKTHHESPAGIDSS